ncbi:MAG: hypothetical protein K2G77_08820, partial [Muribaculaceae bacterium]|nr:hypothetical protein [Muribaculaceae bacterium]
AYAQGLTVLCPGSDVNDSMMCQLHGEAISADGRYVSGAVNMGDGVFIADAFTGEVRYKFPETDSEGCELRGVSNTGLGIGYAISGITYSFETLIVSPIEGPENSRGVLGEGVNNDATLFVGSIQENCLKAAYSKDCVDWTKLPVPAEEDILLVYPQVPDGSAAKKVSGDGKVILGFIGDFGVPCIWTLNDSGEYEADLFPVRFLKGSADDLNNDNKPLTGLSAQYLSLSNNGRYVALLGLIQKDGEAYAHVPIVYDTQEKSLKVYSESQEIDETGQGLYPLAISDDGTFIGTIDQPYFYSGGSFIMKAGETQAEMFINVFPEFNERYGTSDVLGFNIPTGISADGRYIVGYTFYSEDYNDLDSPAYYETYVIDRGETFAVDQVASAQEAAKAIYSIDGRCLTEMTKGINIIRNADGSVKKILKK